VCLCVHVCDGDRTFTSSWSGRSLGFMDVKMPLYTQAVLMLTLACLKLCSQLMTLSYQTS